MNNNHKSSQERVELHSHTVYSSMDSLIRVNEIVKKASELKHPAVAITDLGNISVKPSPT